MSSYDIIIRPVLTEKSYAGIPAKTYTFQVAKSANKVEIKNAIEEIFNVKVENVTTAIVKGKLKRQGRTEGHTPDWKKATVRLTSDSKAIEFFESLS
ncbi:MAG: 50S ribosomal protein L23 [Clostridia bacterium]|nr:50S ribosomal protein L23 [Clostridia bacterium]MBQ8504660.1 50S ribosomal protein L23 [Clostridia bacterium]MBQ8772809.1 50S ribosomal protein L23 [Clostridia bacterium]MBQ8872689.1 50S ribosomal protein L23 [Clostridia bacterium]